MRTEGTLSSRSPDLSRSASRAAVAVTLGAGEGAELALLTAVLERGGRKLERRDWGGGARAGGGGGGRGGGERHVTGRRPRYRPTVEVTSPSPDCRGWHFRSLPHICSPSPQTGGCCHFKRVGVGGVGDRGFPQGLSP